MNRLPRTALGALVAALGAGAMIWLAGRILPAPRIVDSGSTRATEAKREPDATDVQLKPQVALPEILVDPAVRIEKAQRRLMVFSAGKVVKTYPVALGREPVGHKRREGDGRTPEGHYYVCTRNARSQFHRFLGLSYPSTEDADAALAAHVISARDHRGIVSAIRRMGRPPWKTVLGGEIGIHGGGREGDWTLGCIALDDRDAEELFSALPLGTPVEIVP